MIFSSTVELFNTTALALIQAFHAEKQENLVCDTTSGVAYREILIAHS